MNDHTKSDADVFYSQEADPQKYHGAAHRTLAQDAINNLHTPETAKAVADSWMPTLAKYEIADSHRFAEAIAEVSRRPPTAEQAKAWRAQAGEALKADYGPRASEALNDVRTLIAADPKLRAHLEKTGAGNHPTVVRALAASAAAARKAGKL